MQGTEDIKNMCAHACIHTGRGKTRAHTLRSTHCNCGTIPELSEAGVAGVIGVIGVIGEGYKGVVPGKGAVVRVWEWKICGVWPEAPCVGC